MTCTVKFSQVIQSKQTGRQIAAVNPVLFGRSKKSIQPSNPFHAFIFSQAFIFIYSAIFAYVSDLITVGRTLSMTGWELPVIPLRQFLVRTG
jgi:hypothetical protein